jgi:hypothetical protein
MRRPTAAPSPRAAMARTTESSENPPGSRARSRESGRCRSCLRRRRSREGGSSPRYHPGDDGQCQEDRRERPICLVPGRDHHPRSDGSVGSDHRYGSRGPTTPRPSVARISMAARSGPSPATWTASERRPSAWMPLKVTAPCLRLTSSCEASARPGVGSAVALRVGSRRGRDASERGTSRAVQAMRAQGAPGIGRGQRSCFRL